MTDPNTHAEVERCGIDGCEKRAIQRVKSIARTENLCDQHANWVRMIEAEWDRAEAEYLEQP